MDNITTNLEEAVSQINEVSTNNSAIVEADVDIQVTNEGVIEEQSKVLDSDDLRSNIMSDLAQFERAETTITSSSLEKDILMQTLRMNNPEIFEKIDKLDANISIETKTQAEIKKALTPKFEDLIQITGDVNKTLVYNKIQATYVYPTKKHSFDLKTFLTDNEEFYKANITILDPYAKISDVSSCTKITIKK